MIAGTWHHRGLGNGIPHSRGHHHHHHVVLVWLWQGLVLRENYPWGYHWPVQGYWNCLVVCGWKWMAVTGEWMPRDLHQVVLQIDFHSRDYLQGPWVLWELWMVIFQWLW